MEIQEWTVEIPHARGFDRSGVAGMKRFFSIVVVCIGLFACPAFQASAQTVPPAKPGAAPEKVPSVEQILDRYVVALGGRAAIEKLNSRLAKGWVEVLGQDLTGDVEIAAKAPDKFRLTFRVPGFMAEEGYDGAVAWAADSRGIVRSLRGERAANARIDAQFYSDLQIAALFPQLQLIGTEVVGKEAAYVVEAVPPEGSRRWFYFGVNTGLLLRYDAEVLEPPPAVRNATRLSAYTEIDGVKVPMTMRQETTELSWILHITDVRHNIPLDDARFKKPKPSPY